jgi:hypothetical protein
LCYNRNMKKAAHFLLTEQARRLLERLAQTDGISKTAMLEIAIREAARKRGIDAHSGLQAESQPDATNRDR